MIDIIVQFFLQEDKQKHIILSTILLISNFYVRYYHLEKRKHAFKSLALALRDTLLIWLIKEIADSMWMWEASLADIAADIIGLLFPIYLYFAYKESRKIKEKDILNYTDDTMRHFLNFFITQGKEIKEWMFHGLTYFSMLVRDKINNEAFNDVEMFQAKRRYKKEIHESNDSFKSLWKIIRFSFIFIVYGTIDFLIDLIKMPFFILFKTLYIFFSSFSFLLEKFK